MNSPREVLKVIDEKFSDEINLDWLNFQHNTYSYDSNSGSFFRKIDGNRKIDIILYSYGWEGDWNRFINPYLNVNRVQSWIVFEEVSKILFSILKQKGAHFTDSYFSGTDSNCVTSIPHFDKNQNWLIPKDNNLVLFQHRQIEIKNVKQTAEEVYEYLRTYHFPFFERVSSLQVVNDEIINKVPKEEYGNYIPGRFMNAKVLIIMKLCNNPRYNEFRDWALGAYAKGVEVNPDRYLEDFKIIKSLKEYLDSGKYKDLM